MTDGLVVYEKSIEKHVKSELPFMATENIIMECVKAGGDRQELHEKIRVLSQEAARIVKQEGGENRLLEMIESEPLFAPIHGKMEEILDTKKFIGLAPTQTEEFIKAEIDPILKKHKNLLGAEGIVKV